ncbi:BglG family transcription antiterminator LicT [Lachnoanaerobaculum umeaense]|jgi:hypothetical protein|uniref:PRD domain-containing protein n=1 Tax=Lachnoanaerobaculum umeaense TaxID=617123 RepID=A0A385Q429_9FIRM|nr:PRD domain-containing protein [Lachnoanaerobaculum umeaense]AYB00570.1 PRD domain-containing protein [Lachnoanaerobaculum umeaense]PZW92581.1 BglG family transcriptional antiterminator [Lachnoanaerobaculum umeaense]
MIIEKIINNNIVLTHDHKNREIIAMGKGIGFGRKKGDVISEKEIEKIFKIKENELLLKFQDMIADIPLEIVRLTDDIISYAIDVEKLKLSQSIYITLVDHINFSIERFKEDMTPENALMWEIKRFYPQEYAIGLHTLRLIQDRMELSLPDSEAGFIALHFVNAQYSTHMKETLSLPHIMRDIMDIVKSELNVELNENSIHYERFLTHVKFLIQRLYKHEMLHDDDTVFEDMMKEKYPKEFACGKKVARYIENETHSKITRMEMTYLAIHIKRVTMAEE